MIATEEIKKAYKKEVLLTKPEFRVGETVRVDSLLPDDQQRKHSAEQQRRCRRGIVATLSSSNDDEVCVLLLPPYDISFFPPSHADAEKIGKQEECILGPMKMCRKESIEDVEITVSKQQVHSLISFEQRSKNEDQSISTLVGKDKVSRDKLDEIEYLKSCGDQLMKMGDEPSAASFYERALRTCDFSSSSRIQVGSTVILQVPSIIGRNKKETGPWNVLLADIDCVETVGNSNPLHKVSMDITVLSRFEATRQIQTASTEEEDEEQSVTVDFRNQYLLTVLPNDSENRIQERILLNLSRCFLQLASEYRNSESATNAAELKTVIRTTTNPKLAGAFLDSAILSTTLVEAIAYYYNKHTDASHSQNNLWKFTAILLRSKAWLWKGQYNLAMADTEHLFRLASNSPENASENDTPLLSTKMKNALKEARSLHQQILNERNNASRKTRKLVKEVCRWIDGETKSTNESGSSPPGSSSANTNNCTTSRFSVSVFSWFNQHIGWVAVLILFIAFVLQRLFTPFD